MNELKHPRIQTYVFDIQMLYVPKYIDQDELIKSPNGVRIEDSNLKINNVILLPNMKIQKQKCCLC